MPFDCGASCTKHFELAKVWSAGCRWTFNCTYADFTHLQIRPAHESERYIVPWHKYAWEGHYLLIGCSLSWWKALALEYGTSLPWRWSIFQIFPVGRRLDGLEDGPRTPLRCRFDFWLFLMSFVLLQLVAFGQCISRNFSSPVGLSMYWDIDKQTKEQSCASCASCAGNPLALVSTLPICLCTSASLERDLHWIDRCACHALRIGDSLGISADSRAIYVRAVPPGQHSTVSSREKTVKQIAIRQVWSDWCSKMFRGHTAIVWVALAVALPWMRWKSEVCSCSKRYSQHSCILPFDVLLIGVHRSDHILVTALGVLMASFALLFLPEEAWAMCSCGLVKRCGK